MNVAQRVGASGQTGGFATSMFRRLTSHHRRKRPFHPYQYGRSLHRRQVLQMTPYQPDWGCTAVLGMLRIDDAIAKKMLTISSLFLKTAAEERDFDAIGHLCFDTI